jgi:chaperonin GroES
MARNTRAPEEKTVAAKTQTSKSTLKLTPLNDRVVVTPIDAEERTAGGVFLPDTAREKPNKGKVLAVGPGRLGDDGKRLGVAVKAGDVVLYGKYSGTEIKVEGDELKILREEDILGIED